MSTNQTKRNKAKAMNIINNELQKIFVNTNIDIGNFKRSKNGITHTLINPIDCAIVGVDGNKVYTRSCNIRAKYSNDHYLHDLCAADTELRPVLKQCSIYSISKSEIENSHATYWVLLLISHITNQYTFLVISQEELMTKLEQIRVIPGHNDHFLHLWINKDGKCIDTYGLKFEEKKVWCETNYVKYEVRDFTKYINNWQPILNMFN